MARQTPGARDVTEVEVYQLYRGNHREEEKAKRAEDLRCEIRFEDETDIDGDDFEELWEHQGTETFEVSNVGGILSGIWRRWNYSSGHESEAFIEAETRSMEIGDIVEIDGSYHVCLTVGWAEIEIDD